MQLGNEARHPFLKRVAVVFNFLGAYVAAGGEDMAVGGDLRSGGGFAEAGDVVVRKALTPPSPRRGEGARLAPRQA